MLWIQSTPTSIWDYVKRQKTDKLLQVPKDAWNNLPAEYLEKLCASVPTRIGGVLEVYCSLYENNL